MIPLQWLMFLEEHPDPVAIFDSKSSLLFRNRDLESTLTPFIADPLLSESNNASRIQQALFDLPVACYSRKEIFASNMESDPKDTVPMEQIVKNHHYSSINPDFYSAEHVYFTQVPGGGAYWFHLQRRTVDLKEEETQLFYFRNLAPFLAVREAQ